MPIRPEERWLYHAEWRLVVRPRILLRAGGGFGPLRKAYVCAACGTLIGLRLYQTPHRAPDGAWCSAERCGVSREGYRALRLTRVTRVVSGRYLGGAHCEACGVPDRTVVRRWKGAWQWKHHWWSQDGTPPEKWGLRRFVYIILTVAHLQHDPAHNDDDNNLKALCQWCHFAYDQAHHKEVREIHKDARRPLLQEVA